jgi:hypothetical protein
MWILLVYVFCNFIDNHQLILFNMIFGQKNILLIEICLLQGGFTPIDVFSVEWIQSGTTHFGTTVSYFGFVSDGTT